MRITFGDILAIRGLDVDPAQHHELGPFDHIHVRRDCIKGHLGGAVANLCNIEVSRDTVYYVVFHADPATGELGAFQYRQFTVTGALTW